MTLLSHVRHVRILNIVRATVLCGLVLTGLSGCKTTRGYEVTTLKTTGPNAAQFKMQIRKTPPLNCCVCTSDSAFDNLDLSKPENYCTEYFKQYESYCHTLIIGPRRAGLDEIKEAVVAKLGENACSDTIFYQTHGHSGSWTVDEPLRNVRTCAEGSCLPKKLTLVTTGCQAHKNPKQVAEKLVKFAEETGIKHIESWGNQAYDPGPGGIDWTMSGVIVKDAAVEHKWWSCKAEGTSCLMQGSYHHNMGWRCDSGGGQLRTQFCCPSQTDRTAWVWGKPTDIDAEWTIGAHNCPPPLPADPAPPAQPGSGESNSTSSSEVDQGVSSPNTPDTPPGNNENAP